MKDPQQKPVGSETHRGRCVTLPSVHNFRSIRVPHIENSERLISQFLKTYFFISGISGLCPGLPFSCKYQYIRLFTLNHDNNRAYTIIVTTMKITIPARTILYKKSYAKRGLSVINAINVVSTAAEAHTVMWRESHGHILTKIYISHRELGIICYLWYVPEVSEIVLLLA